MKRDFVTSIWFPITVVVASGFLVAFFLSRVDWSQAGKGIGYFAAEIVEGYNEGRE